MAWPRVRRSRAASATRERAGRGQRGIFTERMAGDELRVARKIQSRLGLEHAQGGERDGHQRRLRIFRKRQRVGWALEDDCAELAAERCVDLFEHLRAPVKFDARALPIPTAWLPCPGNTKAIAIVAHIQSVVEIAPKDTAWAVLSS